MVDIGGDRIRVVWSTRIRIVDFDAREIRKLNSRPIQRFPMIAPMKVVVTNY